MPAQDTAGHSMAHVNAISIYHFKKEAPQSKGIKSLSKLLSLKYQSQSSLGKQNRSSSSPKRVYFISTIIVIRKEDKLREACTIESDAAEDIRSDTIVEEVEEVEMESEELEEEFKEETKEEEEDDP
ncbi:hypothetical protein Tco_0492076 [Tanacetum coccineum]